MSTPFRLVVEKCDETSRARAGLFSTPHGDIPTPVFAPVGTQATVKTLSPDELIQLDARLILANTYHLYLRPGSELVARFGGLHEFMGWPRPILTDSGGFQVFSLAGLRKVTDEGVTFRSHIDGSEHFFSPEKSIEVQEQLGADIIMAFDECPDPVDREYNRVALRRTHVWAERCKNAQTRSDQALFGIVQGGVFPDLREESARFLSELDLPGYAIGGLSLGEPKAKTLEMLDWTVPLLPEAKPRYLMGVGSPEDLFSGVARGIDIFDCALPTRLARNGALFTARGRINLRNAAFAEAKGPIDEGCTCYTCQRFSAGYLHHLYKADEILGLRLNTLHNLNFVLDLMHRIRDSILGGTFSDLRAEFASHYVPVADDAQRRISLSQRHERRTSANEKRGKRVEAENESGD